QAARDAAWLPASALQDVLAADTESDEIGDAVGAIDEWIVGRGWILDTDNAGDHLVSWVYPPSATQFDDDGREPVTRIWIVLDEDDDELELAFGAAIVGAGAAEAGGVYLLDPQTLPDDIGALEAYRPGLPLPVLD
ncbi:MAG: hypothetical protein WCP30_17100, partial [Mycobacteriaceae bacterium]